MSDEPLTAAETDAIAEKQRAGATDYTEREAQHIKRTVAAGALAEMGCPPASIEERAALLDPYLAVVGGVVRVVDRNGSPRTRASRSGNGQQEPVTIPQLVEELIYNHELPALTWRARPLNYRPPTNRLRVP